MKKFKLFVIICEFIIIGNSIFILGRAMAKYPWDYYTFFSLYFTQQYLLFSIYFSNKSKRLYDIFKVKK